VGGACGVVLIDEPEARELGDEPCSVTVVCGTEAVPATLSRQPFYDPAGSRLR
jgi:hypothetical protein